MLQSTGSQRVRYDLVTEQQQLAKYTAPTSFPKSLHSYGVCRLVAPQWFGGRAMGQPTGSWEVTLRSVTLAEAPWLGDRQAE